MKKTLTQQLRIRAVDTLQPKKAMEEEKDDEEEEVRNVRSFCKFGSEQAPGGTTRPTVSITSA